MHAERQTLILLVLVLITATLAGCGTPEKAGIPDGETTVAAVSSRAAAVPPATVASANTATPTTTASATAPVETAPADTASTPEIESTPDVAATIVAGYEPDVLGPYPAPDGARRAEVHVYDCVSVIPDYETAYETLLIIDEDSGEEQIAATQLIACGGLGAFGLEGQFWSPDGAFFYFTDAREGVPDGCGFWQQPLNRANVTTGEMERLGSGVRSPDGMRLATWEVTDLVIWSVSGGEAGRSEAVRPDAINGEIVWSPDGTALVYAQYGSACPLADVSLVHVTLSDFASRPLLAPEMPAFTSFSWDTEQTLTLVDDDGRRWFYDLESTQVTPAAEG